MVDSGLPHRDRQGILFGERTPIDRVDEPRSGYHHRSAGATEKNAAIRHRDVAGKRRRQVYEAIVEAGPTGITRQEIADLHGVLIQSVCSAVAALKEAHFIRETNRERQGRRVLVVNERRRRRRNPAPDRARVGK